MVVVRYSQEIADRICERLANGESLRGICKDVDLPTEAAVRGWVIDNRNDFASQYARARDIGLDVLAEEILAISDTPVEGVDVELDADGVVIKQKVSDMIAHRKLQIDSRKWFLSKLAPKKYGDKQAVELTGANGGPVEISDTERASRLQELLATAQRRKDQEDDYCDLI